MAQPQIIVSSISPLQSEPASHTVSLHTRSVLCWLNLDYITGHGLVRVDD